MWEDILINSTQQEMRTCCYRTGTNLKVEEIKKLGPDVFNHHPDILKDKKEFTSTNSIPDSCHFCQVNWKNRESIIYNKWRQKDFSNKELKALATADRIARIEIYFGNTCNLACIYCNKEHSTKWAGLLGEKTRENKEWKQEMLSALFQYLERRLKSKNNAPMEFRFGGGEPFLNQGFFETLDKIIKIHRDSGSKQPGNKVTVLSNLSFDTSLVDRFIDVADQNPDWTWVVSGSVDAMGTKGEAIRSGLDFNKFSENFNRLAECKNVLVEILPSLNSLSLSETPNLLAWSLDIIRKHKIPPEMFDYGEHLITYPQELHISTLPSKYVSALDECIQTIEGTELHRKTHFFHRLKPIIGSRRGPKDLEQVDLFFKFMAKTHKVNYQEVFPILNEILDPEIAESLCQFIPQVIELWRKI